jgi:hypothetical protein
VGLYDINLLHVLQGYSYDILSFHKQMEKVPPFSYKNEVLLTFLDNVSLLSLDCIKITICRGDYQI